MTTYEHWNIQDLRNHHFNAEVFGELQIESDCTAFVDSVMRHGILQPLVIAADGTIIAGHRRRQAAARAGLQDVPVLVRRDLTDPLAIDQAWFETNRNREMTVEQKARWFAKREAIEAVAARCREMSGSANPAQNSAQGRGPTAAEIAAAEVGLSRPTAKSALKVVRAIDSATAEGNTEKADRLRETLNNQSVAAAARAAEFWKQPESSGESVVTDELNRPVPQHLRQHHEAAAQIKSAASKLDAVKKLVNELHDLAGGVFLPLQQIEMALKDVKALILHSRYWTECPRCQGQPKDNCDRCDGHGFLPYSRRGTLSVEDKAWLGVDSM